MDAFPDEMEESAMICPKCGSINRRCYDSRPCNGKNQVRRRYRCLDCDYRFTTYELTAVEKARLEMK